MIQRGRVTWVSTDYSPAVVSVEISGGLIGSGIIEGCQVLGDNYDPFKQTTPRVGADVLVLIPTGNVADGAYVIGLVAHPAVLVQNLANNFTFPHLPTDSTGNRWSVTVNVVGSPDSRILRIVGIAVPLAKASNVDPFLTVKVGTEQAEFKSSGVIPNYNVGAVVPFTTGERAELVTFEGVLVAEVAAFDTPSISIESGGRPITGGATGRWSWEAFRTVMDEQEPERGGMDTTVQLQIAPSIPLIRIHGKLD